MVPDEREGGEELGGPPNSVSKHFWFCFWLWTEFYQMLILYLVR